MDELIGKTVKSIREGETSITITFTDGTVLSISSFMPDYDQHALDVDYELGDDEEVQYIRING